MKKISAIVGTIAAGLAISALPAFAAITPASGSSLDAFSVSFPATYSSYSCPGAGTAIILFDPNGDSTGGQFSDCSTAGTTATLDSLSLNQGWNDHIVGTYTFIIVGNDATDYGTLSDPATIATEAMTADSGSPDPDYHAYTFSMTSLPLPPAAGFSLSTGTAPAMLASASASVKNPGVLEFVGLVAGVYISFYVLRALIGLVPRKSPGIKK